MTFAEKLKELRLAAGLQIGPLGKRVGASRSLMGMFETGDRVPKAEVVRKLADALGVHVADLATLLPEGHPARIESTTWLPYGGAVAAGPFQPLLEAEPGDRIEVAGRFPKNAIAFRVSGHSCTQFGICHGFTVVIREGDDAGDGDFVVAESQGGQTLKAWWHGKLWGWGPKSADPEIVELDGDMRIRGIVIDSRGKPKFSPVRGALVVPKKDKPKK